jgi:hypothetical protein
MACSTTVLDRRLHDDTIPTMTTNEGATLCWDGAGLVLRTNERLELAELVACSLQASVVLNLSPLTMLEMHKNHLERTSFQSSCWQSSGRST